MIKICQWKWTKWLREHSNNNNNNNYTQARLANIQLLQVNGVTMCKIVQAHNSVSL